MRSAQDEKLFTLQAQVEKLQSQKDILLKELDTVEEQFGKMNRLYGKYFPVIIDALAIGDTAFLNVCKDLSMALKKGESHARIEYIFEHLKTAILKEEVDAAPEKKNKGLLSSFLKNDPDSFIDEYKQSYHDIIINLRSNLDEKYTVKLNEISASITNAEDRDDISRIRESVFSLIFVYISNTSQDQEKVNAFVREVVSKILEIESKLATTYQQADSMFKSNEGFESVLSSEMQEMKENSDLASNLDELKIQIADRLVSIENALLEKQDKDRSIREDAVKNRQAFKTGFAKLRQELDEVTRYSEELEKKLNQDQLTGAYNRRAYDKKIKDEMARFSRYGTQFSLMLIDADEFKFINDTYGHAIGDKCLKEIIRRTIPLLRQNDMLARYGGDEFVVIMPETDSNGAKTAAEKIRNTIEKIEFIYKNNKVKVTVSIGISQSKKGDKNYHQIFERTDIAVYKAKEQGRNQILVN